MLHVAFGRSQLKADSPLGIELQNRGTLRIVEQGRDMSDEQVIELMREADVLLTMWGSRKVPAALADEPGKVRYVLNLTGTCREYVPLAIIRSPIPVTNWGDAPAFVVAEGAMALLMTVLKDMRPRAEKIADGHWGGLVRLDLPGGTLRGLKVGLYGCGAIGQRFVKMIAPFEPHLAVFDPYAPEIPADCQRVDSLEALFDFSEALVIWAGLTDETRHSVTAELLAKLPDHGIIINAARGGIIDQNALFGELRTGRLRAGLDVLDGGDCLPENHEARKWPNLILTCHDITAKRFPARPPQLSDADRNSLDNLDRFVSDKPLRFEMDESRYLLST